MPIVKQIFMTLEILSFNQYDLVNELKENVTMSNSNVR